MNFKHLFYSFCVFGVLMCAFPAYSFAAGVVVQHKNCYASTCTFDSPVAAGDTIIVTSSNNSSNPTLPTDTLSNTYVLADSSFGGGLADYLYVFYAENVIAGSNTVTLAGIIEGVQDTGMAITEVSGLVGANSVDVTKTYFNGSINTFTPTTDPFVTTQTDFIFVAIGNECCATTGTAGLGYTFLGENGGHYDAEEYAAGKVAGTYTASFNAGAQTPDWNMLVVAFKEFNVVAPTVTTQSATDISTTSVTLNGTITATGGADALEHGFAYGTVADLSTVLATTTLGSLVGTSTFSYSTTTLDCATAYYFRPYATNITGTGYGSIVSFTTSACPVAPPVTPVTPPRTPIVSSSYSGGSVSGQVANLRAMGFNAQADALEHQFPFLFQGVPQINAKTFIRVLKKGSYGMDVKALQIYLNTHGFPISTTGVGSRGFETQYYGPATASAVSRFQEAYATKILTPNGLSKGTGVFGPSTRAVIEGM
ncbi:MAG: peptidoglycan-binding domain-containing protein [Patescibacteria group bacterium]